MFIFFIQMFLFVYVAALINIYKSIFISPYTGRKYEAQINDEDFITIRQNNAFSSLLNNVIIKTNQYIKGSLNNTLVDHPEQIKKIADQALLQQRLGILAVMCSHLIISFLFFAFYTYSEINPNWVAATMEVNEVNGRFGLFIGLSLIALEVCILLFTLPATEENKNYFLQFVTESVFRKSRPDFITVFQSFTNNLHQFNNQFTGSSAQLKNNLDALTAASSAMNELVGKQSEYQQVIQNLKLDEIITKNTSFYKEIHESMVKASNDFSQFAHLSRMLNETLNKSIVLYGELNKAIERDLQFTDGLQEFNKNFKANGHVTTQLVHLLNKTQNHLNQVVQSYAPKIEQLDEQFFAYLQKRLEAFRLALQKNDDLILQALEKRYGSVKE